MDNKKEILWLYVMRLIPQFANSRELRHRHWWALGLLNSEASCASNWLLASFGLERAESCSVGCWGWAFGVYKDRVWDVIPWKGEFLAELECNLWPALDMDNWTGDGRSEGIWIRINCSRLFDIELDGHFDQLMRSRGSQNAAVDEECCWQGNMPDWKRGRVHFQRNLFPFGHRLNPSAVASREYCYCCSECCQMVQHHKSRNHLY